MNTSKISVSKKAVVEFLYNNIGECGNSDCYLMIDETGDVDVRYTIEQRSNQFRVISFDSLELEGSTRGDIEYVVDCMYDGNDIFGSGQPYGLDDNNAIVFVWGEE